MEENKEFVKVLYKKSLVIEMMLLSVVTLICTVISYINIYSHTRYLSLIYWVRSIGLDRVSQYASADMFFRICICASLPCLILFILFTNRTIEKMKIANQTASEVFKDKLRGQDIIKDFISQEVINVGNMLKGKKYVLFCGMEHIHIYALKEIETVTLKKNLFGGRLFYDMKIIMKKTREEHIEPLGSFDYAHIKYVIDVIRDINDEVITNGNN